MIYFDNAATTKVCPEALEKMDEFNGEFYFNPSSLYLPAVQNAKTILETKDLLKKNLGANQSNTVVFTASATEANNLLILGAVRNHWKQLLFSQGEHPSVYNVAIHLKEKGFDVKFVPLQKSGEIDYDMLEVMLKEKETSFISIMAVNNETGAKNDLKKIARLRDAFATSAIFHSDFVQAFGKIAVNMEEFGVDACTISAHKIYGPKGIGALCFNQKVKVLPIMFGGGQENNLRSGTENVGYIMALNAILKNKFDVDKNFSKVMEIRNLFLKELIEGQVPFEINGGNCSPYVLSLSLAFVRGETMQNALEEQGVLVSTGSACSSKKVGNRILEAMGQKNIIGSVRISFSINNTFDEAKSGGKIFVDCYNTLISKLKG
ncbi:MAG: cysteine desulfurase family protein [Clostridia bacterium]